MEQREEKLQTLTLSPLLVKTFSGQEITFGLLLGCFAGDPEVTFQSLLSYFELLAFAGSSLDRKQRR